MNNLAKIYVGVDVSKNRLDIHLHPIAEALAFANSKEGIELFINKLGVHAVEQIVCESTGGYEDLMLKMLRSTGYKVWQAEPNRIKSFIRSKGKKVKTDASDAYMLALFSAQERQEHPHVEYGVNHNLICDLVKRKRDLGIMVTSEKLRLGRPNKSTCFMEIKDHIVFMEKQVKALEAKIEQLIKDDDDFGKKAKIMQSVPGVGKATAARLIAGIPELGSMENKKAAALVGVAPYAQESGQYRGKRFISGGRSAVREALYMAAMVASRYNPIMKEFYRRLRDIGKKPAKVALVAVMRKLITILNIMIKRGTMWDENATSC